MTCLDLELWPSVRATGEQLVVLGDVGCGPGVGGERGQAGGALQGPVHGWPADAEQAGDLGDAVVAAVVHAADLAVLGGPEGGLLAAELAVLAGDGHALAGPLADEVSLELGDDGRTARTARICRNIRANGSFQSYTEPPSAKRTPRGGEAG